MALGSDKSDFLIIVPPPSWALLDQDQDND